MVSLDWRTRTDGDVRTITIREFCEHALPEALRRNGPLAARGLALLKLRPLAFEVDGAAYTLRPGGRPDGGTIDVASGADDDAVVAVLSAEAFSDLVQDVRSATSFLTAADAQFRRGSVFHLIEWEPVLRAIIDGRPVHEPGAVTLCERDGTPLDLTRSFVPADDDADMAYFLAEAGFLHLRGWFTASEMATVSDDIDAALPGYAPDDGRSWWATLGDGSKRCVRMQWFHQHSTGVRQLLRDDRFLRIGRLTADGYQPRSFDANAVEALVKPIGVVEGISDLPWHKDCSLGRHSFSCCSITVGVSVTGADADTGQLCVVAGSHRANLRPMGVRDDLDLPVVPLPTATGDLTVHLSCTLHMSMAPSAGERRVLYTGFGLPPRPGDTGAHVEKLARIREAAPRNVSQVPAHLQRSTPGGVVSRP